MYVWALPMGQATVPSMVEKVLPPHVPDTSHRKTKQQQAKKAEVGLAP